MEAAHLNAWSTRQYEDMKKSMVAKIIDPESCKSGQIAVNSAKDLSEGNVAYGYLDTSRWGIQ